MMHKAKKKEAKTCVMSGHRYAQANTINVNKT